MQWNLVARFGVPNCLVFDNAKYFSSFKIVEFALKYNINLKYSANYYPQGNGVAESTNKNLLQIIKKTIAHNILREGYYWPTLFIDAHAHARKCKICQVNAGRE